MEDSILYHIWMPVGRQKRDSFVQLVVPKSLHLEILQAAHDDVLAGHLGIAKAYEVIRRRFYWDSLIQDSRSKIQDPRSKIQKSSSKKSSSKKSSSSLIQAPRKQAPV